MWGDSSYASLRERLTGALRFGRMDDEGGPTEEIRSRHGSEDRCSTRRVIKTKCKTEEVEPGKFVKKCEKTEQLLRDCVGRPTELVESKTEYTEDDVPRISTPLDERHNLADLEPNVPPVLRGDFDLFERTLFGGLDSFIHAAEEMANDFFENFRFHGRSGETQSPFGVFRDGDLERGVDSFPYGEKHKGDKPHKQEEPAYADYAKDFEEI